MSLPDVNGWYHSKTAACNGFTNSHSGHVLPQSSQRERIPSIRNTVDDKGNSGPTVSERMGVYGVTQSESR